MKKMISMLVAVAVAAALAGVAGAADAKTGQGKGPAVVPGESVLMTCAHCKDDYVVKLTKPPKGSTSEKAVVGKHLCEKCGDKLTVKGAGKAKTAVTEHTCKNCEKK